MKDGVDLPADSDFHYVDEYTGYAPFDSFVAMWLLALGEFDLDDTYSKGSDSLLVWIFFISATFLVLIVFMNMMIAIMGDTFGRV